jgi:peptide/nickel transport system permease protein
MSAPVVEPVALPTEVDERTARRRRLPRLGRGAWAAVAVLVALLLFAVVGPFLVSADPTSINLSYAFVGPTSGHPLGFDGQGRDLLARLASGSRTALLGPLIIVAVSTVLGATIALAAAWRGGWFDNLVARVVDAMFAFPGLLLAILAVALFGTDLVAAAIALSIAYTPYVARLVRAAALRERALPYVSALEVQGFRGSRIVLRHVLPNLTGLVVAVATLSFGYAIIDLASLSFIGLGVQPPQPDWGQMVSSGVPGILQGFPQESMFAAALIVVTVGAVNYLGDRLTAVFEEGAA